jgi:hypothetical protein
MKRELIWAVLGIVLLGGAGVALVLSGPTASQTQQMQQVSTENPAPSPAR